MIRNSLIALLVSVVAYFIYTDLVSQQGHAAEPPYVLVNGILFHVEDNKNYEAKETIVFSHAFPWSTVLWKDQVPFFNQNYRIINYDHRGQGQSETPRGEQVISVEQTYEDAVALLETLNLGPVHFVGCSMGSFVAMRIAARRPELLKTVTLIGATTEKDKLPAFVEELMSLIIKYFGGSLMSRGAMSVFFLDQILIQMRRATRGV